MPGFKVTENIRLNELQGFVQQVATASPKKVRVLYENAGKLGNSGQRDLLQSIINSASGEKGEVLALSMLHEALANSYSETVAAQVFEGMSNTLFTGKATLSTGLIANVQKAAEEAQARETEQPLQIDIDAPPSSNVPQSSVPQVDIDAPPPSSVPQVDIDTPPPSNVPPSKVLQSNVKDKEQINHIEPKQKPKKNAAAGRTASSRQAEIQAKLTDISNKTNKVKKTYRELNDLRRANARKRKARQVKMQAKRREYQNKLSRRTRRRSVDDIASWRKKAETNTNMQATLYFMIMEKGGNEKGVMSFDDLIKASTWQRPAPRLSDDQETNALKAIRKAFSAYDTDTLATMNDMDKTTDIVIPTLRAFLAGLQK